MKTVNTQTTKILYILIFTLFLLLIMNVGLFVRINQLQATVDQIFSPKHTYLPVGKQAPTFVLEDTDGKSISLQQFLGKYVILVFSSPTCPACKSIYPDLENLDGRYPDVTVLLLSYGSKSENQSLVKTEKLSIPVLIGEKQVFEMYKVKFTPTFYLIDTKGVILRTGNSLTNVEEALNNLH